MKGFELVPYCIAIRQHTTRQPMSFINTYAIEYISQIYYLLQFQTEIARMRKCLVFIVA